MRPLIVDPDTYDKRQAFDDAVVVANAFLDLNGLPHPAQVLTDADDPLAGTNWWRMRGWYDFGSMVLHVNLKKTRSPVRTPGFAWSFTGSKADLTAAVEGGLLRGAFANKEIQEALATGDWDERMEGLYIKWEEDGVVKGRYKLVRETFTSSILDQETHWHDRPIVQNRLVDGGFDRMFQ